MNDLLSLIKKDLTNLIEKLFNDDVISPRRPVGEFVIISNVGYVVMIFSEFSADVPTYFPIFLANVFFTRSNMFGGILMSEYIRN